MATSPTPSHNPPTRRGGHAAWDIKSVLVGVSAELEVEPPSSAILYASSLAEEAGAHLTVMSAALRLTLGHGDIVRFANSLVAEENRRLVGLAEAAANAARKASGASTQCETLVEQLAFPDLIAHLIRLGRAQDLTILDAEPVAAAIDRALIKTMLMETGRPLIVVPLDCQSFRYERIVVAWDGSAKAARAMNDAMGILRMAKRVDLSVVYGEKDLTDALPGVDAAHHLARHNVPAELVELRMGPDGVADTLRRRCGGIGADLLVMGAFVHSPLRQLVLGGTTQSLLKSSPVPLFLSY